MKYKEDFWSALLLSFFITLLLLTCPYGQTDSFWIFAKAWGVALTTKSFLAIPRIENVWRVESLSDFLMRQTDFLAGAGGHSYLRQDTEQMQSLLVKVAIVPVHLYVLYPLAIFPILIPGLSRWIPGLSLEAILLEIGMIDRILELGTWLEDFLGKFPKDEDGTILINRSLTGEEQVELKRLREAINKAKGFWFSAAAILAFPIPLVPVISALWMESWFKRIINFCRNKLKPKKEG